MNPEFNIDDLWAEAIAAKSPEEVDRVLPKLRQALHEHCEEVRGKLRQYPLIARRLVRQINDLLLDQETVTATAPPPDRGSKMK